VPSQTIFSVFERLPVTPCGLLSLQNTENDANLLLTSDVPKQKDSASGGFAPDALIRGSALDPAGGSALIPPLWAPIQAPKRKAILRTPLD